MTKNKKGKKDENERNLRSHSITENLFIDAHKFATPRNKSQNKLFKCLNNQDYKIILASGPAGTGKTLFSVEQGIKNFISEKYNKIIFTRPSVGVDENIGFLPGSLEDKMMPWMRPIYDIFHNFMTQKNIDELMEEKRLEIVPLGFMRGRTFKNCWIVADEMQNSTISQMKMLLTRIGENTRLVITGDCEQNDLHHGINGLEDFLNKLKGRRSDSIGSVEFDTNDVEREEVVKEVLEIYKTNRVPYDDDAEENTENKITQTNHVPYDNKIEENTENKITQTNIKNNNEK